jgi:hypothetical protein
MLKSVEWSSYNRMATTLIGFSGASGIGMGIWFPGKHADFQCPLPADGPKDLIIFYKALAICSAFYWAPSAGVIRLQFTLTTLMLLTCSHPYMQSCFTT